MKTFTDFLMEAGGQAAGSLEIAKTGLPQARSYAEKLFQQYGRELDEELPKFDSSYKKAQMKAKIGWTLRRDMPVITDDDVKKFQTRLKKGMIDINEPYADEGGNPFPEGLRGAEAKEFLSRGLRDGEKTDDVIKVTKKSVTVSKLNPIQKQIYFDKSIQGIAEHGVDGSINFMTKISFFICSSDYYIIDGHHRFLGSMLIDPKLKVQCLVIDLPISKLLPATLAYGDAIGNRRNL